MYLSVVIPAFNEAQNLRKGVLEQIEEYLENQKYDYEVLIVDDGSTDKTVEIVEEIIKKMKNFKVLKNDHGGKALTVMEGMLEAEGQIVLFTDMDQATPISEVEKLLPFFKEGYDVVIGSRTGRKGAPPIRKLMAWAFATTRNIILGLPFRDTQCGFKAFDKKAINEIFPLLFEQWKKRQVKGPAVNAGFDVETLFLATKKGLKIAEVGVEWHHVGTERVQMFKDSLDAVKDILRIKGRDVKGNYQ